MHGSSYIEKRLTASQRAADLKSKTTVLDGLKERRFEIAEPRLRHRKVGHPAEPASRRGRREHFLRRGRRSYYAAHLSIFHLIVTARNAYSGRLTSKRLLREASGALLERYIPLRKHSRFLAPENRWS